MKIAMITINTNAKLGTSQDTNSNLGFLRPCNNIWCTSNKFTNPAQTQIIHCAAGLTQHCVPSQRLPTDYNVMALSWGHSPTLFQGTVRISGHSFSWASSIVKECFIGTVHTSLSTHLLLTKRSGFVFWWLAPAIEFALILTLVVNLYCHRRSTLLSVTIFSPTRDHFSWLIHVPLIYLLPCMTTF